MAVQQLTNPQNGNSKGMMFPNQLTENETYQSLTAWELKVKNFYRRDDIYYPFVNKNFTWDPSAEDYGVTAEHRDSKLKRDKQEMAEDLVAFIRCISGFLPDDDIREKLETETKSFADIMKQIRQLYDAEQTPDKDLDFMFLKKSPQETHRKFFERLSAHARRNLVGPDQDVNGLKSGTEGDKMTLSLMNMVVKVWLFKTDPRLTDLVSREFGDKIKSGTTLYELVPKICKRIDSMLKGEESRNSSAPSVKQVKEDEITTVIRMVQDGATNLDEDISEGEVQEIEDEAVNTIRRLFQRNRRGRNGGFRGGRRDQDSGYREPPRRENCPQCEYIKRTVSGSTLDTNHHPRNCPNKRTFTRLVRAEDEDTGGEKSRSLHDSKICFQRSEERRVPPLPDEICSQRSPHFINPTNKKMSWSNILITELTPTKWESLSNEVRSISTRRADLALRKEKSPTLLSSVGETKFVAILDGGAEINVLSAELAKKLRVDIIDTTEGASAANGIKMKIIGQTKNDFHISVWFRNKKFNVNLGKTIVVENLGADILVGAPGLVDNSIYSKFHEFTIHMMVDGQEFCTPYFKKESSNYSVARVSKSVTVQPGDFVYVNVPEAMKDCGELLITPRRQDSQWFDIRTRPVRDGKVAIKNTSLVEVSLSRKKPFAEIRSLSAAAICENNKTDVLKVFTEYDDHSKYVSHAIKETTENDYLSQVKIDPDGQMPESYRKKFWDVTKKYGDIVNPAPGKYNAYYGPSDTSINFVDTPPPTDKIHTVNFSDNMMKLLGDKMDKLIEWGVLVKPEVLGVSVEHISPCMLVPKADYEQKPGEPPHPDGYRLVTDFSKLNTFIKKYPGVSPTIQDTRRLIAKKKYNCHIDLSNYFYQGGMSRYDAQYLGVNHPTRGCYLYSCQPQGLKNSSEQSYDRLGVIYGDMVRDERMARYADGIHPLGDTWQELLENYEETMLRASKCGLTFKPSKLIVAPVNITLFGWRLEGSQWRPTSHSISTLTSAKKPTTVKQLRGFLGALRQYTDLVPRYATILHELEQVQAGRSSSEWITWNETLEKKFDMAKKAAGDLEAIHIPRPTDKLHTYSDYSASEKAVGGRLVIERIVDGEKKFLLGGHFSKILKYRGLWLPCEGEAASIRLVLENFSPWIRESLHTTTHHTDNISCVNAWKRLKRGAFSTSGRISAFLTGLSTMSVTLIHTPGSEMFTSDYASRNPRECEDPVTCQICRFAEDLQKIGDEMDSVKRVTVEEVMSGVKLLPLTQKLTWRDIQKKDAVHEKLRHLINIGQSPNVHKTGGDFTKLKLLYKLYSNGDLYVDKDDMIMVKSKDGVYDGCAISVPHTIFPGVVHALHVRLDHPSKAQLTALVQRHLYCPGWSAMTAQVSDACSHCASMKTLPKVLTQDSSEIVDTFGTHFSADVLMRYDQKILLVREKLTQFTYGELIPDQTADTLAKTILKMILPVVPHAGAEVKTDGATAFQSLENNNNSVLSQHNIKIKVGRLLNVNKNPVADNCVKEFEKEVLRYDEDLRRITDIDLITIIKTMNTRIRHQKFSSQEMVFKREMLRNSEKTVEDESLSNLQQANRKKQSQYQEDFQSKNKKVTKHQDFKIGDLVYRRNGLSKHEVRELFIVDDIETIENVAYVVIRKLGHQIRRRTYHLLPAELIRAPQPDIRADLAADDLDKEKEPVGTEDKEKTPLEDKEKMPPAVSRADKEKMLPRDNEKTPSARPRRKAAEQARELFRGVLSITKDEEKNETKKKKRNPFFMFDSEAVYVQQTDAVPFLQTQQHVGGYDIFEDGDSIGIDLLEIFEVGANENQDLTLEVRQVISVSTDSENELQWDDSPEQIDLQEDPEYKIQQALLPRNLFSDEDDEVFTEFLTPQTSPPPRQPKRNNAVRPRNEHITRQNAFRRNRPMRAPASPTQVNPVKTPVLLSQVELAEPVVQDLSRALATVSDSLPPDPVHSRPAASAQLLTRRLRDRTHSSGFYKE